MDAHGVHVFDEADGDHLVLGVADDFQLQFFPAEDGFLDQNLSDEACGNAAVGDRAQFFRVVDQPASGAAHGISWTNDHGVAQFIGDLLGLRYAIGRRAFGHINAQLSHRCLKGDAVLAALNGVHLDADDLYVVFFEHAGLGQLGTEVKSRLSAQVGQERVRALLGNDFGHARQVQRLDVGCIGHAGIGHDCGRIGIDQHDLEAQFPQGLAGLRAGIIEFAGLPDHDRPGSDDHYFMNVGAFWHGRTFFCGTS